MLVILQLAISQRARWEKFQRELVTVLKDPTTTKEALHNMMVMPDYAPGVEGTIVHEYAKPESVRRALFLRCRQRFVTDAECVVAIPEDFDFAQYLSLRISTVLSEVVEIGVIDWVALWIVYLVLYLINAFVQVMYEVRHGSVYVDVCLLCLRVNVCVQCSCQLCTFVQFKHEVCTWVYVCLC